jgi:predicted ribosome quality control (RQC) complex YloA/Tae2 family protein
MKKLKKLLFNYRQMEILLEELQSRICGYQLLHCTSKGLNRLFFVFQKESQIETLFFSFTSPCIHFHLKTSRPAFEKNDCHQLETLLPQATLIEVKLLQQDRILELAFDTSAGRRSFIGEFFSKHPNYYLIDSERKILLALHPVEKSHYTLPPLSSQKHPEVAPLHYFEKHAEIEETFTEIEGEWIFHQAKQSLTTAINKQIKKFEKRKETLEKSLKEASQWEKFQHEAELLKANVDKIKKRMRSIDVWDWLDNRTYTLSIDPLKTPQELLKESFKRVKKLQASQAPLQKQLKIALSDLEHWLDLRMKTNDIIAIDELRALQTKLSSSPGHIDKTPKSAKDSQVLPYKRFISASGVKIWVGKNGKSNDQLTFHLANGRDWWLHASGYSGSHVIIRSGKDEQPDFETLQDAMLLALYFSKAREQGECEICYTQRKYLSRVKNGKVGTVQMSKHKTAWVKFDPHRFEEIQKRHKSFEINV